MKNLLIVASVGVLVWVSAPRAAAGQEAAGGTVVGSSSIGTIGWNLRPPRQLHPEAPPQTAEPRGTRQSGPATRCVGVIEARREPELSEALRPVEFVGIWVFPPGGMTRYLIPSRVIIDVESDAAAGLESGSG